MARFEQQYNQLRKEETFGAREVGISHPDNPAFFKIADNGDCEISCGPGLAFILHRMDNSVTIVADKVRFLLKDKGAITINDLILNTDATNYSEPTFIERSTTDHTYLYDNTVDYLEEVDKRVVLDPEDGRPTSWEAYVDKYKKDPTWNGSFFE
jgi:hypothetical protein